MCRNQARREHHAREEAMREATRRRNEMDRMMREAEERNQKMIEALKPPPQTYTPPPAPTQATLGTRMIKSKKTGRARAIGSRRGISALRIPLNVGQSATGGTNLPT